MVRGEDGYFYGHVGRTYRKNTGGGPANTAADGTCAFRTRDPMGDPAGLRGWNGSAWSTQWVNPYVEATPADELWRRTCADVNLTDARTDHHHGRAKHFGSVGHLHAKKFSRPLVDIEGWPTHVLTGLAGEKTFYFFPDDAGAASGVRGGDLVSPAAHPDVGGFGLQEPGVAGAKVRRLQPLMLRAPQA